MNRRERNTGLTRRRVLQGGLLSMTAGLTACLVEQELPPTPTPEPGNITFLHGWQGRPGYDRFLDYAAQQWRTQRPDLEVTWLAKPGPKAVVEHFLETTAADKPIAVTAVNAIDMRDLYEGRHLRDVRFATRQPEFSEISESMFLRSTRQYRNVGAETFGLPVSGPVSRVLAIDTGVLESAGLKERGADLRTWDDLDRVASQLTKRQGEQITRSGYALQPMDLAWFTAWVNTTATTLFNPEQSWANFDSEGALASLEHLFKLHSKLRVSAPIPQTARDSGGTLLESGEAVIHDSLSSAPLGHYHEKAATDSFWQIPYPAGPGGYGPNTSTSAEAVVVHSSIERPGHALTFCKWFCGSMDVALVKFELLRVASPLTLFYKSKPWIKALDTHPVLATIPDIAEIPGAYAGFTAPYPYRRYNRISKEIVPILAQAYRSGEGLGAALKQAHIVSNTILSQGN